MGGLQQRLADTLQKSGFSKKAGPLAAVHPVADGVLRSYLAGSLNGFCQAKRDFFRAALAASRFELLPSHGTYFQLAR